MNDNSRLDQLIDDDALGKDVDSSDEFVITTEGSEDGLSEKIEGLIDLEDTATEGMGD